MNNSTPDSINLENLPDRRQILEQFEIENNLRVETNSSVMEEINRYLSEPRVNFDTREYWLQNQNSVLYNLFLKNSSIQLSTIKSEQSWSKTSLLNTKKRAKMISSHLSELVYINMDYSYCEELKILCNQ